MALQGQVTMGSCRQLIPRMTLNFLRAGQFRSVLVRPLSTKGPYIVIHPDWFRWMQGLWVVQAPGEAEATCAALNRGGYVDACATVDSDVLLFGAETAFHTLRPLVNPPSWARATGQCLGSLLGNYAILLLF